MTNITAALVKELREKSGAGMMDCKKALTETSGNLEDAVDYLRKKGLATASKKAGRIAAEGLVSVSIKGDKAAIIELNSETDFVAKNTEFQDLCRNISEKSIDKGNCIEEIKNLDIEGKKISEHVTDAIAKIGENINLRRVVNISAEENGVISSYVHNSISSNLGRIAVAVAIKGKADDLAAIGKKIAMHIACLLYTSPSPRDLSTSRMPSSA